MQQGGTKVLVRQLTVRSEIVFREWLLVIIVPGRQIGVAVRLGITSSGIGQPRAYTQ